MTPTCDDKIAAAKAAQPLQSAELVLKSKTPAFKTLDANEAAAYVAYRLNEVMAIYPITPSSPIAEWCDRWASEGKRNLWGTIPADALELNI